MSIYPTELDPFQPALSKIKLSEYEILKLNEFLKRIVSAKNINELNKTVNEALDFGIRINAPNKNGFSFSQVVVLKMQHSKFKGDDLIKKLALYGADFNNEEFYNKVKKQVQPQLHNRRVKLREAAERATISGTVKDVEFDNCRFYIEFSRDSTVDMKKVIEGTKSLGFDRGDLNIGGNIVKIGDGEVEVKTGKNGERDYVDISNNSAFTVTFSTSLGEFHIKVYQSYNQVKIEPENKELWHKLQEKGEKIGNQCLFGE
ncbi:hypothetical protein [Wolbachia endosymbiont of Tetranychus urticae]|uniref:hypothetical protein n=1 Tax=Wolbachia endosymbiont of Tetranychus urticae TaxID=169184 RepID=UPI00397BDC1D